MFKHWELKCTFGLFDLIASFLFASGIQFIWREYVHVPLVSTGASVFMFIVIVRWAISMDDTLEKMKRKRGDEEEDKDEA